MVLGRRESSVGHPRRRSSRAHRRRQRIVSTMRMSITRNCDTCGVEYTAEGRGCTKSRYCSKQCYRIASSERRKAAAASQPDQTRKCVACSKEFAQPRGRSGVRVYCSSECRYLYDYTSRRGMSIREYNSLRTLQGNRCAICSRHESELSSKLCIDHDHSCCNSHQLCGKCTRGLLCSDCNTLLGYAKDSVSVLKAAVVYLKDMNEQRTDSE